MIIRYTLILLLSGLSIMPLTAFAEGQGVPINYDSFSFFEEPLAIAIGPATLNSNILVDQAVRYNSSDNDETYNTRVDADFNLEMQLPTTAQIGMRYFTYYDRLADNDENEEYRDNFALFISDEWGTLAGGNVTNSVYEKARRKKSFGNAKLANDSFIGELDEAGAYYSVRYNSYEAFLTADQEGRAETALTFERPIGKSYYFASARLRKGDLGESDTANRLGDTYGGALVGRYIYASFCLDGQLGYELIDPENSNDYDDHVFSSVGAQYKYGAYRFSVDAGLGRYNGDNRRALALGSRIDLARGTSFNLGLNYKYQNARDDTTALASIRYEF